MGDKAFKEITWIIVSILLFFHIGFWLVESSDPYTWSIRGITFIIFLGALYYAISLHRRKDVVPDFQLLMTNKILNCQGFCFYLATRKLNDVTYLYVCYQSQYSEPSHAKITLIPAKQFWFYRRKITLPLIEIDCPPAGFGYVGYPLSIPEKYQGKFQSIDINAYVTYPFGKGKRLRFQSGEHLSSFKKMSNSVASSVLVRFILVFFGVIVFYYRAAHFNFQLPTDVSDELVEQHPIDECIIWKLGDTLDINMFECDILPIVDFLCIRND